jgi:hypothetical protein
MFGFVLQDWNTIRGNNTAGITINQNESDWMGFSSFQDMVFWIDIREATFSSATINLALQTSPSKDDVLFQTMYNASLVSAGWSPGLVLVGGSTLPRVILAQNPTVPLATWVRWQLTQSGATAPWDLTFRILVSANRVWRR